MLFLHSNYYSLEKTKSTIDNYYVVRAENPEAFTNWSYDEIAKSHQTYEMVELEGLTPRGHKVLVYRLKDYDPSKIVFLEALRTFLAFNDVIISEDGLCPGYEVVFDMKGTTLTHLARVASALHLVKMFMVYIQECHPVRLKAVHVINTVSFMDSVLSLVKPLMQSELVHLLILHNSLDTLEEFVPLKMMPRDYGGDGPPVGAAQESYDKFMKAKYSSWLKECHHWAADLKKRPQKSKTNGMEGSFRTLQID
ncbi:hypothetical protein AAG570_004728 [Ranatra chinensis]|uniref:CRAL-TRIO domain-containing protein n=1 Tax=Ranatra chinensis TaxID=642074 RepID=A0ABD0Y2F5_9HEMI